MYPPWVMNALGCCTKSVVVHEIRGDSGMLTCCFPEVTEFRSLWSGTLHVQSPKNPLAMMMGTVFVL